jgi:predicted enzyme related to lactoylglutathione lyase
VLINDSTIFLTQLSFAILLFFGILKPMLNLNSIMIGTSQPKVLAEFYAKVFDRKADWEDGGWFGWQFGDTNLSIGEHSEVSGRAKEPQRIILNIETKELKEEFERIKESGAEVIKEPYGMGDDNEMQIATFADPDGNYFQLMIPWEQDK